MIMEFNVVFFLFSKRAEKITKPVEKGVFRKKKSLFENHCITNANVYNKAYIDSDNKLLKLCI